MRLAPEIFKGDALDWLEGNCPPLLDQQAEIFLREATRESNRFLIERVLESSGWSERSMSLGSGNPIRMALDLGHKSCFQTFITHLNCERWTFENRQTLLHFVIQSDIEWAIDPLLQANAPLHQANSAGLSPIALASYLGRPHLLDKLLAKAGVSLNEAELLMGPAWRQEARPSALATGLVALAGALIGNHEPAEVAFIKESCRMLAAAGSSANEPCGSLALMTRVFGRNFTCPAARVDEALAFALRLGARFDAPGLRGALPLEIAAGALDQTLTQSLMSLGATLQPGRSLLAAPAWQCAIRNGRALETGAARTLAQWCDMERFWPPMASNEEAVFVYFETLSTLPSQRKTMEAERLALFISAWEGLGSEPINSSGKAPRL